MSKSAQASKKPQPQKSVPSSKRPPVAAAGKAATASAKKAPPKPEPKPKAPPMPEPDVDESMPGGEDIEAQLAQIDAEWEGTEAMSNDIPDGRYKVKIDQATLNNAKSSGRLQVSWHLKIVEGEQAGRFLFKHDGLDTPESRAWFKTTLVRLGVEPPARSGDIPGVLEQLIDTFAEINAKTKDSGIQNVYFNKGLDPSDVDESGEAPADEDFDDSGGEDTSDVDDSGGDDDAPTSEVSLSFDDSSWKAPHERRVKAIGDVAGYDMGSYESKTEWLAALIEAYGGEGEFATINDAIKALEDLATS